MPKTVTLPYQNFTNATMTATTTLTSEITNIMYRDSVAIELDWTGTPTGTFTVQGSNSYIPDTQQNSGPPRAGTWIDLSLAPSPVASGAAGKILINLNQLGFAWIRVQYTNASGSGTLNGFITAKSLGV